MAAALRLVERGRSSRAIAAELGVADRTIRMWRSGQVPGSYSYLLGLYLGDGWIVASANGSYALRISLDQSSRYSFSNRSDDIRAMFCAHLDLLGIGWTRPNRQQIAIDRRSEVAKLDAFVGPKR